MPDFALSNPFLWPGLAEKLAQQEAAGAKKVKDPKEWKGQAKEGEEKAVSAAAGLSDEEKMLRHQLLQAAGFKVVAEGDFWRVPGDTRDFSSQKPPSPVDAFVLKFQKPQ